MQPVVAEGVIVFETDEEQRPVVFAIATSGPVGAAVKFVVGDGYVAGFAPAADDVLTADEGELAAYRLVSILVDRECGTDLVMIDPHIIRIVQGDRVSSPDILWVQVLHGLVKPCTYTSDNTTYRNMNVLYNHILIAF